MVLRDRLEEFLKVWNTYLLKKLYWNIENHSLIMAPNKIICRRVPNILQVPVVHIQNIPLSPHKPQHNQTCWPHIDIR